MISRLRRNIVVSTIILIFFLPLAFGLKPPVKIWGEVQIDGQSAPEGVLIELIGDCGNQQSVSTTTVQGAYVIDILMDSPDTPEVEGCMEGQTIQLRINSDQTSLTDIELPVAGELLKLDVHYTSPQTAPSETGSDIPSTGGSGGGSGGGGSGSLTVTRTERESEEVTTPLPPIRIYGTVYAGNNKVPEGYLVSFMADCFDRGEELIASSYTNVEGQYTFDIPMDTPATTIDEGCLENQEVTIVVGNQIHGTTRLAKSGMLVKEDIYLESKPELQEPAELRADWVWKTEEGKEFADNLFYIFTLLFMVSAAFLLYTINHTIHKK